MADEWKPPAEEIAADMAEKLAGIINERGKVYGSPVECFQQIADHWSLHIRHAYGGDLQLSASDVAMMMVQLKMVRFMADPAHLDNAMDGANYFLLAAGCEA